MNDCIKHMCLYRTSCSKNDASCMNDFLFSILIYCVLKKQEHRSNLLCDCFCHGIMPYKFCHLIEQEAPLTLRGQRGRCRNIEGELQIFGSFPRSRLRLLFLRVWFLVGLGKPNLCTKFEVASPSRYRNIIGEPPNGGELP